MFVTLLRTKFGGYSQSFRHLFILVGLIFSAQAQAQNVNYLDNGRLALSALYAAIKGAEKTIDLAYYEVWSCDSVTKTVVQAINNRNQELKNAGKPFLKVRLMADYHPFSNMKEAQLLREYLRRNGIDSRIFNTTGLQNRNHSKIAIFDGKTLITGGRNMGDAYYGLKAGEINYVDRDVMIQDTKTAQEALAQYNRVWRSPYAHGLDRVDIQDYREARVSCFAFGSREKQITAFLESTAAQTLASSKSHQCIDIQFVTDTRVRFAPKATAVKLNNLLQLAEKSIHMENYSYLPFDNLDLILRRKRPSVQIQVFTNHFAQNRQQSDHDHLHRYYLGRDEGGEQSNFPISLSPKASQAWQFTPRGASFAIHSKVYVVDTKHVAVTSSNIDPRSFSYKRNLESGVTIKNCPTLAYQAEMTSIQLFKELGPTERASMSARLAQYRRDESFNLSLRYLLQSAIEDML